MKKLFIGLSLALSGCGISQKQLRQIDGMMNVAKNADCETAKQFIGLAQKELQKKIK